MKTISFVAVAPALLLLSTVSTNAFVQQQQPQQSTTRPAWWSLNMAATESFEVIVDMPPTGSNMQAQLKFKSVLNVPSEIVEVRYKIPFGLNVEPKNNLAICTKDGEGGERVGDILRFTSQWTMGLPRGDGLVTTAASFAGGLKWQCSMFDVMKAKQWEQVVEALTSNVQSRTDEVLLLFERPLETDA